MSSAANQYNKYSGCRLYGCLLVVGLCVLLVGIAVLLVVGRESAGQRRLQAKLDALRTAGLPYDSASLKEYHERRTDPQDTQRWLTALKTITSDQAQQSAKGVPNFDGQIQQAVPLPGQPWEAESERATRAFLDRWRELHQEIFELSLRGKPVRFPIEFDSMNPLITHVQDLRQAIRLLQLHGQVSLHDGDSVGTQQAVLAILGSSKILSGEPLVISQLVSIAADGIALDLLQQGLKSGVLQPPELRELLPAILAQTEIGDSWRSTIIGERGWALPNFSNTAQAVGVTVPGRAHDALLYLEITEQAVELPTEDLDQFRAKSKRLQDYLKQRVTGNWLTIFDSVITGTLIPSLHATGSAFVRRAMQHRLAAVAIGLRLYEIQHGQFPQSLPALAELQLNLEQLGPASSKSFGYRVNADGTAQLWSHNQREPNDDVPAQPYDTTNPDSSDSMWVWELKPSK